MVWRFECFCFQVCDVVLIFSFMHYDILDLSRSDTTPHDPACGSDLEPSSLIRTPWISKIPSSAPVTLLLMINNLHLRKHPQLLYVCIGTLLSVNLGAGSRSSSRAFGEEEASSCEFCRREGLWFRSEPTGSRASDPCRFGPLHAREYSARYQFMVSQGLGALNT